jgi:2'-5' RNA ligase
MSTAADRIFESPVLEIVSLPYANRPKPSEPDAAALTAAAAAHTGAMVALIPSAGDAARLAVIPDGEPVEELHVTLAYLGEAATIGPDTRAAIIAACQDAARATPPTDAEGFALSLFNPTNSEQDTCIVLGLSGDALSEIHRDVVYRITDHISAEQHEPWIPHLTLLYTDDTNRLAELIDRTGPVNFDRLRVAFAGENTDIPLEAAVTTPALLPADTAPVTGGGDYGLAVAPPAVEHFHTVVMEGVSTGLRTFASGSLSWREPPFAFHYEYSSAAHGGQMMTAQVGVVTRAERIGDTIHFWGPLDLADPMALEYARKLVTGFSRWSSIGIDESLKDSDVEMVFPEKDGEGEDDDGFGWLFMDPEQIIFHKARIAEITAVSVPALADATVEPMQALVDALGQMGVLTAADMGDVMTAAGYTITIPDLPPAEWFDEPAEEPAIGALTITDQGRLFGWLAPAGVSHRGFRGAGRMVVAPTGVDYSEFMNKTAIVEGADGQTYRINAGNVTMSCEHASPVDPRRGDPGWATQHYENSCSVFARIRVGESRGGTWVAGALLPDVNWSQVSRALGCALSGDWQGGKLKAALLVPVEGFPTPAHASIRIAEGVLVSSAVPVRFRRTAAREPNLRPVLEAIARRVGRDSMSRLAELRARRTGKAPS